MLALFVPLLSLVALFVPASAQAGTPAPSYVAVTVAEGVGSTVPLSAIEHLPPGGEGKLLVQVTNVGDENAEGSVSPIVVQDVLPEGLDATAISSENINGEPLGATCELSALRCSYGGSIVPFELSSAVYVVITVRVGPGVAAGLTNEVDVSGGGLKGGAVFREAVPANTNPTDNGLADAQFLFTGEDGLPDTVAGSHPFQVVSTIVPNTHNTKDLQIELPDGVVGNTNVVPQCSTGAFDLVNKAGLNGCAATTAIGVATVDLAGFGVLTVPLFNLVPSPGEPARFGFEAVHVPVILDTSVRTGHGYGVSVHINNIPDLEGFEESQVAFWGVPAEVVHNPLRGWNCLLDTLVYGPEYFPCEAHYEAPLIPFLTLPTSCHGPQALTLTATADTWQDREFSGELALYTPLEGMQQCGQLRFEPSLKVAPDGEQASTPTGLTVDVHEPQAGALNPTGTAGAAVRNITVALPEGVVVNPAGADGLQACSEEQIGYTGMQELEPAAEPGVKTATFTPEEQSCPTASKIGTVKITTPLLPNPLEGSVYLATQDQNPFGSLLALYIVARDPVSGVLVKLPAEVSLNPVTGQVTTTVENSPQLPFEDAELHFFGGSRAPLATPARCGSYTTTASFEPWSDTPTVENGTAFDVKEGPNGGACPGSGLAFGPSLTAETTNINAGGFSPLATTITREDGQQNIDRVTLKMPPGLTGILTGVPLCHEAEANVGTCPAASKIGSTIVSVGLGGDPYSVTGGEVFLTEKYEGAPFGLSIVNPAVAGPFNLGKVIVRARIEIDPRTAALTVTTGEIPHILDGIPLQIKHVHVEIERPGFIVNPTSCEPMQITGSVSAVEGASANVSEPFQVTNCTALKFNPVFTASTSAKDSFNDLGASLTAKVSYPKTVQGAEANIAKVKVELPKALPSRLTTLQKACLARTFEANPAACPAASFIGHAVVHTQLIPVPLEGPAIFVSHGGEAFPSIIIVLQGYGIKVELVGTTFISHAGVTSTTFKTVPDQPFETFELTLQTSKFSALVALTNVCKPTKTETVKKKVSVKRDGKTVKVTKKVSEQVPAPLLMPTEFVGQNGAEFKQTTKIGVTGCPKAKVAKKAKAKKKAKRKRK
jgi:hypothetical protein